MTIPDYQSLMLPLLKQAAHGETRVPEVAERLADELGLTVDERDQLLPSGRQKLLHNRIHWRSFTWQGLGSSTSPAAGASSRVSRVASCWRGTEQDQCRDIARIS